MLLFFSRSVVSDSFVTPWTVALQTPQSMGFPRQEFWSGLPFPFLEDLSNPGIEPESPVSPALAGRWILYHRTSNFPLEQASGNPLQ